MTCECGYADECDGETAIFYPLQDGGMCSVRDCYRREDEMQGEWRSRIPNPVGARRHRFGAGACLGSVCVVEVKND